MAHALIFDSGVGGLSVVSEIRRLLPDLDMTYVADDAFRPYGEKSAKDLKNRLPGLLRVLADMTRPDVIVIACNTASTTALADIRNSIDIPVVGVVPAIKPAAKDSQTKVIGLLGTPGTVQRQYVGKLISDFASDCYVIGQGSVGLVEMAETKLSGGHISLGDVQTEISEMFEQQHGHRIDTVVLACTHFPLLKQELKAAAPHYVTWIDSGEAIAKRVESILSKIRHKDVKPVSRDHAFLIGPNPTFARSSAFKRYGFKHVIGLMR